jgi:hypothetical protein
MPTYDFRIKGGDETAGFEGTICVSAQTAGDAHDLAWYKAAKITGLLGGTLESVEVTLIERDAPAPR